MKQLLFYLCIGIGHVLLITGCDGCAGKPLSSGPSMQNAYPRQIVGNYGFRFTDAFTKWDIGTANEVNLDGGLHNGRYFQIPDNAAPGIHEFKISGPWGDGDSLHQINVLAAPPSWPIPRIENVGIAAWTANADGTINITLAVAATNGDADATVEIDGTSYTPEWKTSMPDSFQVDHQPNTFNYPIFHHTLYWVELTNQALGSSWNINVKNHDNQPSTVMTYSIPATTAEFDSDGDGLLDDWENNGYMAPDGSIIRLDSLGCRALVKDILVECDWISASAPLTSTFIMAEEAFAAAPVLNPGGRRGINLIIDYGQGGVFNNGGTVLPDHTTIDWDNPAADADFDAIKANATNFDPNRLAIFRYGILGRARPNGTSGRGEVWGNDFIVSFTDFSSGTLYGTQPAQVGTFIHELGHTLGLAHGGLAGTSDQNESFKSNQHSLMNYNYQFGGIPIGCNNTTAALLDYSNGIFNTINETSFNETTGICDGLAFDHDGDGSSISTAPIDVNGDGQSNDVHFDYNEWGNLQIKFDIAGSLWRNN